jgi:hypothetical protein
MSADGGSSIDLPGLGAAARRCAGAALGAALLALACAACSPAWHKGRPDPRQGENCVRDVERRPVARTINYVEPELCGRKVAKRGPYHVRTPAVRMPLAEQGR